MKYFPCWTIKSSQSPYHNDGGFTLLEVMISLLILSICIGSLILTTLEMNKNQEFLKNKTIALWLSQNALNEVILGLNSPPYAPEKSEITLPMANKNWIVITSLMPTDNKNIDKITTIVKNSEGSVFHQMIATRWKNDAP